MRGPDERPNRDAGDIEHLAQPVLTPFCHRPTDPKARSKSRHEESGEILHEKNNGEEAFRCHPQEMLYGPSRVVLLWRCSGVV